MNRKKCLHCAELKNCRGDYKAWFFFVIGLIATVSIRFVTFLMHIDAVYGKIAWYIGVTGFFIFFLYKFSVLRNRSYLIKKQNLLSKLERKGELTIADYKLISGILCSLSSIKERINFFFIFLFSGIALILALYMDFIR